MEKVTYRQELIIVLILAAIQFAHILDFVVIMPLGPVLMDYFSIEPAAFGSLVSSYHFSAGLFSFLFSFIADKYDRKLLLLVFILLFGVGTFLCFVASSFTLLLAARIATGACGGVLNSLVYSIISDFVPEERRGRAMGIVMSSFSISSIVGIPIGLLISEHFGWNYSFLFIFFVVMLALPLASWAIPTMKKSGREESLDPINDFKKFFSCLVKKEYALCFLFIFLSSGGTFLLIPFLSPYAVKNMKIHVDDIKYMYFYGGILTVVTARIFGVLTDRVGAFPLYAVVMSLAFIPILAFGHAGETTFWTYIGIGCLFMSFVSGRMIPAMTLLSQVPRPEDRGAFMSFLNSIRTLGAASMTLVGGMFIVEGAQGSLLGFDQASYFTVLMGLFTIVIAYQINKFLPRN